MALFESYERREKQILAVLKEYGINSIEEAGEITKAAGLDVYAQVEGIQPICFENAKWAYTVGAAIAIKKGCKRAADAAAAIGEGLQAFCIPGSVADQRKVGLGHGNLGKMLLEEETECFAFLAGHESFAAAEGAIGIAEKANKVRQKPLRVILNGLGKDAAQIISRINGFTYVETEMDYYTGEVKEVFRKSYSEGLRAKVNCYGANDVTEGVAIMHKEGVDVSITGNSTNPTRFQHPVAGTYKKECIEQGKKYFSVASGGGTGRTLHPDNMAAGPASYGMTDTMGRMHSDAQFAGSSSVPAHVEMMGLIGMGNNPMVGATVAVAESEKEKRKRTLKTKCTRGIIYFIGLIVLALGIVLNTKTLLGVSPIISIPYNICHIWHLNLGAITFVFYCFCVLIESILKGKEFKLYELLQIPMSLVTSVFINIFDQYLNIVPDTLGQKLLVLFFAIVVTGIGAATMVNMKLVPNPADALAATIGDKLGKGMGIGKNVFDVTCFCTSGIIGLVFTRHIIGLGIGTVLAVIFTGRVIAVYNYFLKHPMQNLAGITVEL